jgi:hypothetical protein
MADTKFPSFIFPLALLCLIFAHSASNSVNLGMPNICIVQQTHFLVNLVLLLFSNGAINNIMF